MAVTMTSEVIEELEEEVREILCQEVMGRTDLYYEREKLVSIRARLQSLLKECEREVERVCETCRHWMDYSPSIWGNCPKFNKRTTSNQTCPPYGIVWEPIGELVGNEEEGLES